MKDPRATQLKTDLSYRDFVAAALVFLALLAWFPFTEYAVTSSWGGKVWMLPILCLSSLVGMAFLNLLILPFVWMFGFFKGSWIKAALWSVALVAAFILGGVISQPLRMRAFERLAARSAPLVTAIHAYETKHGRPPAVLSDLVPTHIARVPETGMKAYPFYEYQTGDKTTSNYAGNPWVLRVHTPGAGINFDCFLYFPKQNYPAEGYGGALERIGTWAYVHE